MSQFADTSGFVKLEREDNLIVYYDNSEFKEELLGEYGAGPVQGWSVNTEFLDIKQETCPETQNASLDKQSIEHHAASVLDRIETLISENDKIVKASEQATSDNDDDEIDDPPNKKIYIMFKCNYCEVTCRNEEDLKLHVNQYHIATTNFVPETSTTVREKFRCEICCLEFNSRVDLEFHTQTHSQVSQCSVCLELFVSDKITTDNQASVNEICTRCKEINNTDIAVAEIKQDNTHSIVLNEVKQDVPAVDSEVIIPDLSFPCLQAEFAEHAGEFLTDGNFEVSTEFCIVESEVTTSQSFDSNFKTSTSPTHKFEVCNIVPNIETPKTTTETLNITKFVQINEKPAPKAYTRLSKNIPTTTTTITNNVACNKDDLLERIDKIINKNSKIMHECEIPKKFPKNSSTSNQPKKETILNRIECIIQKNASVLDASKVAVKPATTMNVNCSECGLTFYTEKAAQEHIETAHKFIFPCPMCNQQFSSVSIYNEHLKVTHNVCKACNESFKYKADFIIHESNHKNGLIKFFQCQICYNDFKKLEDLTEHLDIIHGIRQPYSFPVKTVKKYLLNNINQIIDLLQCVYCDVKFTKNEQLQAHLRSRHGVESSVALITGSSS